MTSARARIPPGHLTGLALLTVLVASACAGEREMDRKEAAGDADRTMTLAEDKQELPPGWTRIRGGAGGGEALLAGPGTAAPATEQISRAMRELAAYLGARPEPVYGFRDGQDVEAHLFFRVSTERAWLAGVAVAFAATDRPFVGVAYDEADRLGQTIGELLSAVQDRAPVPRADRAPRQVSWHTAPLPDGSGTIRIPQGWRVVSAHQGAVDVAGPNGEWLSLGAGLPIATPEAVISPLTGQPMPGSFYSPPLDPVTAVRDLLPRLYAMVRQQGFPAPMLGQVRILEGSQMPSSVGGRAALLLWETTRDGRPYRAFGYVDCSFPTAGYWMFYSSIVWAPTEIFEQALPVMVRAWSEGWRIDPRVFQQRLQQAYSDMRETNRILSQASQARSASFDRSLADWTEVFRGTRIVRDTELGEDWDFDIGWVNEHVDRLNERAGYERFEQVPLRSFVW